MNVSSAPAMLPRAATTAKASGAAQPGTIAALVSPDNGLTPRASSSSNGLGELTLWAAGATAAGAIVLGFLGRPLIAGIMAVTAVGELALDWFMNR